MNQKEFSALIKKYQQGDLSPEQKDLVDKWLESISTESSEVWTTDDLAMLRENIMEQLPIEEEKKYPFFGLSRRWLPYAAAILLISLGGIYYYQSTMPSTGNEYVSNSEMVTEAEDTIPPGSDRATLTLADGRTITLSSDKAGIVVGNGLMYEDGTALLEQGANNSAPIEDYLLSTPKGGQYKATLPDGSRVWLNAASTLTYPSRFTGGTREVELTGEAYFEIAKHTDGDHRVPFIVKTNGQEVVVLGTQFNIAAYSDEVETRTTLVEGAVMVRQSVSGTSQKETKLVPGEESVLTSSGIKTRKADIVSSTAWKSGIFAFDNIPFEQMLKQIARWYNIDVVYEGDIPQEQFKGKMSRNVDLNVLINFLRDSGINLRAEGRTLYIGK